jgi:hypothetical protein
MKFVIATGHNEKVFNLFRILLFFIYFFLNLLFTSSYDNKICVVFHNSAIPQPDKKQRFESILQF